MGLDSVELIMCIEEELDIDIPEEALNVSTVSDLADYLAKIQTRETDMEYKSLAYELIKKILIEKFNYDS